MIFIQPDLAYLMLAIAGLTAAMLMLRLSWLLLASWRGRFRAA